MHSSSLSYRSALQSEYLSQSIYIAPCLAYKALRYGSHNFTCKLRHPFLFFVSVYLTAPPLRSRHDPIGSLIRICWLRRDERLSWPGWLTYSGRFTHMSGYPSATGRSSAGQRSSPAKYRQSTAMPRNQAHGIAKLTILTQLDLVSKYLKHYFTDLTSKLKAACYGRLM